MGIIKEFFYRGEYAQVLEKTYEDRNQIDPECYSYIVGSLNFLGRTEEAQAFYQSQKGNLTSVQKSYSYFFMAIGLTRRSQYSKAKKYLLLNRKLSKSLNHSDLEIKFLVEQGISFFLFFLGQFEKSLSWSQKSLSSSMATQDFWMKSLSYDLLANNQIQLGKIHEGLKHLEEAIKFSNKLKNTALAQAFEISHLIFRCEYGINLKHSFNELVNKLSTLKDKDAFSKANLSLEYVRQLTLRGEWALALKKLDDVAPLIYQSQNRRQEARLNLRWAEIYYLKNEASTALHYIRSGKRCLEFIDQTYEIQFLGIEIKVYENLKNTPAPLELKQRLNELSLQFHSIKNNHILSREFIENIDQPHEKRGSDDEIHQLLLKAAESPTAARKIILETGFMSWIYRFFKVEFGEKYILLNFESKSITCVTGNGFSHKPNELSTLVYKILTTLSKGFTSKEELVTLVWGYQYDPLRHDSLIYSSFSSIRKILGTDAHLIETSEMGYKLNAKMINLLEQEPTKKALKTNDNLAFTITPQTQPLTAQKNIEYAKLGLNARQIQILSYLNQNQFIAVKNVTTLFSTSEITANRDLRSLTEKKLVLRIGQGRATQYTLTGALS